MTDDPYGALHRRFDKLESNFEEVREEQHQMSKSLTEVNHRIDMVEFQIDAAHKREAMVVSAINEKLSESSNLTKKLFDKFDMHDAKEAEDRKERAKTELSNNNKVMWWLVSTCLSVLTGIGFIMFNKVFV